MAEKHLDPLWIEHGYGTRFQGFQNLMRHRIRDVLLVSSLYDLYLFEEDGRFDELISNEYQTPQSEPLSGTDKSIERQRGHRPGKRRTALRPYPDNVACRRYDSRAAGPAGERSRHNRSRSFFWLMTAKNSRISKPRIYDAAFDRVFVWQGDFQLIVSIIKHLEDRMNVDHDTRLVGIQSILFIEDNIHYYSTLLPILYTELLNQSQRLISEGINLSHKFLRTVARPKILLCQTLRGSLALLRNLQGTHPGHHFRYRLSRGTGSRIMARAFALPKRCGAKIPNCPSCCNRLTSDYEAEVKSLDLSFMPKDSPNLALRLRQFMTEYFSFGDFIFRTPDGFEVGRASDLKSLREQLQYVPEESIRYHAERNHFSNWLKARTEFWLAHKVRPRKVSDFPSSRRSCARICFPLLEPIPGSTTRADHRIQQGIPSIRRRVLPGLAEDRWAAKRAAWVSSTR